MEERKLALLIDSDNVSVKYLNGIFDELAQYGIITYRRIYGDFTSHLNARWSDRLLEKSIIPIQQFSNTTGKNATDSALIIDAMDLLYTSNVDGFCIVSSDSDFTRLASRLRESGKIVIGMGEKKTPDSFRAACTIFTELENLIENEKSAKATNREAIEADIINIITQNDNRGKATGSGEIGSKLQNKYPDFDIRSFGYSQLSKFLEDIPALELRKENNTIMVGLKEESGEDPVIRDIVEIVKSRGGHSMSLATLGHEIRRRHRSFNVALYGYSQLYAFIDSLPGLSVVGERTERRVMYTGDELPPRAESSPANAAAQATAISPLVAAVNQRQMQSLPAQRGGMQQRPGGGQNAQAGQRQNAQTGTDGQRKNAQPGGGPEASRRNAQPGGQGNPDSARRNAQPDEPGSPMVSQRPGVTPDPQTVPDGRISLLPEEVTVPAEEKVIPAPEPVPSEEQNKAENADNSTGSNNSNGTNGQESQNGSNSSGGQESSGRSGSQRSRGRRGGRRNRNRQNNAEAAAAQTPAAREAEPAAESRREEPAEVLAEPAAESRREEPAEVLSEPAAESRREELMETVEITAAETAFEVQTAVTPEAPDKQEQAAFAEEASESSAAPEIPAAEENNINIEETPSGTEISGQETAAEEGEAPAREDTPAAEAAEPSAEEAPAEAPAEVLADVTAENLTAAVGEPAAEEQAIPEKKAAPKAPELFVTWPDFEIEVIVEEEVPQKRPYTKRRKSEKAENADSAGTAEAAAKDPAEAAAESASEDKPKKRQYRRRKTEEASAGADVSEEQPKKRPGRRKKSEDTSEAAAGETPKKRSVRRRGKTADTEE